MDIFFVLLFIIVIAVILVMRYSLLDKMDRLEREIVRLREDLRKHEPAASPAALPTAPAASPATPQTTPPAPPAPPASPAAPAQPPIPSYAQPHVFPPRPAPKEMEPYRPAQVKPQHAPTSPTGTQPPASPPGTQTPVPPSNARAPHEPTDWEKFIGENLISKIGIAILVLAIGFFVKYAIDNDWIGPAGRVGVGFLCGAILIGLAHRLRKQYKAFSSVLIGGGLAALYFTVALAYHQYHLLGQAAAFILMLAITAFSVTLSLLYNRQELAIIALVGGFVTPFLVSNGSGDYKVLFTYLLILNTGLLVIAYYKAWRLLNSLAFGFTIILFASWLIDLPDRPEQAVYSGGAAFATAFYCLFFTVNIARTIRERTKFIASDFLILLLNTCLYFGASLYFLSHLGLDRYKGLYCTVMGVVHIVITWVLFRKQAVDRNILYLLIGITLSFVSLTAPLQLHGHYITLFWASEAVLLYWLYLKSQLRLIGTASRLVLGAMVISLVWDWTNIYLFGAPDMAVIFNKGCMTGLFCAAACYAQFRLQSKAAMALAMLFGAAALIYISGALEIGYQFHYRFPKLNIGTLYLLLFTFVFLSLLTIYNKRLKLADLRLLNILLLVFGLVVYLATLPAVMDLQGIILVQQQYGGHFMAHWLGTAVVLWILYHLTVLWRASKWEIEGAVFSWAVAIIAVVLLSAEGQMLVNEMWYGRQYPLDELQRVYNKTGLPILWGLCSFVCMWIGMRYKFRPLRIFSLVLFMITLLKLFLFDIRDIPVAGKIAAFFCLGVLLLIVSFMYQRLKKFIIDNEAKIPD